jgi:TFIIH basal transcription factor complex TTD-A subunit
MISGVLVQCDPSIKSIIVKIDSEDHAFIVEELDDQTLVVKENMMSILKMKLDEVSFAPTCIVPILTQICRYSRRLRTTMKVLLMTEGKPHVL